MSDRPRDHASSHNVALTGIRRVTMSDLKTLAIEKIRNGPGLDGIVYDEPDDKIILTNHSRPGTLTAIDPASGDVVAIVELEDNAPEDGMPSEKLFYTPDGGESNVTVVHQDATDKYTVTCERRHVRGREDNRRRSQDAPGVLVSAGSWTGAATRAGSTPPAPGQRGRGPQGPIVAACLIAVSH